MERCWEGRTGGAVLGGKLILKRILEECDVCEFMRVKVVSGDILWNQYNCFVLLNPIRSQYNPIHDFAACLSKFRFNIIALTMTLVFQMVSSFQDFRLKLRINLYHCHA
jgi:hypothetical protein